MIDDHFELYDLEVSVEGDNFVCRHHQGTSFRVEGEDLVFPAGTRFSLYALSVPYCRSFQPSNVTRIPMTG